LNILTLPATALIAPKIVEADANNFLDVMALGSNNATIHALLHTLIEAGQPCWLSLEGKKADGTAHNLTRWNGLPSQVNATWISQGFWPNALANSYLKQLGHGTTLTIKFKVSLDKSNNLATATVFPDRTYTIKAVELVVPTISSVKGSASGIEIPNGSSTVETAVTLSGTASKGLKVEVLDGAVSKGQPTADPDTGIWTQLVSGLSVATHSFTAKALYGSGVSSAARTLIVRSALTLNRPSVKEALGDKLNPIAAKDTLTVIVPHYTGMLDTDQLSVTWAGTAGDGSYTSASIDVGTVGTKEIPIPNSVVAFNLGKPVTVTYTVIRNGAAYPPSQALTLAVQTIPNHDGALPMPAIDSAVNNVLDVTNLSGTEQLRVAQWPLQTSGQRVWLRYDGVAENGSATKEVVWEGPAHNKPPANLVTPAAVAWLKTLKDGSQVKITFRVNFDKVASDATAVTFPLRTYTVRAIKLPELVFNTSPITSNRKLYVWPTIPNDVIFFGSSREASGGRPPYVYSSSNSRVSSVNPSTGRVTVLGKGTATITVRDQAAQSKSYDIFINEAVFECFDLGRGNYSQIENIANARGLRLGTANGELSLISNLYKGGHWPINDAEGTWFKSYYSGGNLWGITFIYSNKGSGNTSPTTIRCGLGLK
jgi:hypothetical protein